MLVYKTTLVYETVFLIGIAKSFIFKETEAKISKVIQFSKNKDRLYCWRQIINHHHLRDMPSVENIVCSSSKMASITEPTLPAYGV